MDIIFSASIIAAFLAGTVALFAPCCITVLLPAYLASIIFILMGVVLLALAFSGNAFWAPFFQVRVGEAPLRWSQGAFEVVTRIPDFLWGIIITGVFLVLLKKAWKIR